MANEEVSVNTSESTPLPDYYVHVKAEFLIVGNSTNANIEDNNEYVEYGGNIENSNEDKRNGRNYKRPRDERPSEEDRLCGSLARGDECPYGNTCRFSHDILGYLSKKPADISEVCYQYQEYGFCPFGLMCRFGKSHIDYEKGLNLKRPVEDGGVVPKININVLQKAVQTQLRKKNYPFRAKSKRNSVQEEKKEIKVTSPASANKETEETAPTCPSVVAPADTIIAKTESATPEIPLSTIPSLSASESSNTAALNTHTSLSTKEPSQSTFNTTPYESPMKLVDFSNKVYVAPLTTVGNLPFRRVLKGFQADVTCGEMAMGFNLLQGQASEWALLRRHPSENCFGVQVAGSQADQMSKLAKILEDQTISDFVDLNCGCPIDVLCDRGCGAAMMNKPKRLREVVGALANSLSRSLTVKIRTGWDTKSPSAHKLVPELQKISKGRIAAVMVHGRSRLQRYHKLADWDYILQVARSQDPTQDRIPVIGNGDILSWEDWYSHRHMLTGNLESDETADDLGLCDCAMLGRGALIKPWLPVEIKEQRHWDISASERLDMLKQFVNYGLDHWGSDQQGVNSTRRFLLEWLSFLHRYVPIGLLDSNLQTCQKINQRNPHYYGRSDLETLMASGNCSDWLKIATMLLGPLPENFYFEPKHRSNAFAPVAPLPLNDVVDK